MQINSVGQQSAFGANIISARNVFAVERTNQHIVANYGKYEAPLKNFKAVLKYLPGYVGKQDENTLFLVPKNFGDIICMQCDGQESREKVIKYLNEDGFEKVVVQ